jgi:hypothetical protein
VQVDIAKHELEAMYEVVLYVRAMSKALGDAENPAFAVKLQNYAQMVEDVADRVERTSGAGCGKDVIEPWNE